MRAQDTIAAIATPPGVGGIAILRLSGPEAERILTALCGRARWESHRLYYCRLRHAGRTLDEAMAVLMRAPHSYTRSPWARGRRSQGSLRGAPLKTGALTWRRPRRPCG